MDHHHLLPQSADLQPHHFPDDDSAANDNNTNLEVTRRSRGRPAGSKNKPKPPIVITRDSANSPTSHVMEIAAGCDIVERISAFSTRRNRGLFILSGSGAVSHVTLLQRSSPSGVVSLHGTFEMLSLSGSFLPPPAPAPSTSLTVCLDGGNGKVIGGIVAGQLVASRPVMITVASFADVTYERLPLEEEELPGMLNAASAYGGNENQNMTTVANSNCQLPAGPYWGGANRPTSF